MLILARKLGEKIVIPEIGVSLEVVAIKGNTVRLGIHAPPDIAVIREEILDRYPMGRSRASTPAPSAGKKHTHRQRRHAKRAGLGQEQLTANTAGDIHCFLKPGEPDALLLELERELTNHCKNARH